MLVTDQKFIIEQVAASWKVLFYILLFLVLFFLVWVFLIKDRGSEGAFVPVQNLESVRVGRVEKVASQIIYTCEGCGYKFSFPESWGFVEEGNDVRLTTDKVEFRITTLGRGEEFAEAKEGEYVIPYSSLNVSGMMRKSEVGGFRQSVVEFENKGRKYVISSKYKEEDDLDRDLPAFLVNFQFLSQ